MLQPDKPICLITGASAGIGAALAREYASHGWDLILTARRKAPMAALGEALKSDFGTTSHIFTADLFEAGAVDDLLARIKAKGLQIDGVINNAGYGHPDKYLESDWDDHARFIQLMMTVPSELTYKTTADMAARGYGRVMSVASLAGHLPGSRGHTLYAAVKSYLIKFSQSLWMEMDGSGVHVTALCPGFVYTEFHDVNGTREAMNKLPKFMIMDADKCAKLAYAACEKNQAVVITGAVNKFIARLARVLPTSVSQKLMARNSDKFRKG